MTAAEAAERAGILGVPLFDAEPTTLTRYLTDARDKVALLPKKAGRTTQAVKYDF